MMEALTVLLIITGIMMLKGKNDYDLINRAQLFGEGSKNEGTP